MNKAVIVLIISLYISFCIFSSEKNLDKIILPEGFKIELFADGLDTARSMAETPENTVFVGSMNGKVYALRDENRDNKADKVFIIDDNLNMPAGVDYYQNDLYVSSVNRILKYPDIEKNLGKKNSGIVIRNDFPSEQHHGWKFIKFGPDHKLYVPVGAPCNVCLSKDKRFATIMRMDPDGKNLEIFAYGVRNTVGFDWDPKTGILWFTDNGRDRMGDNIPPDELNYAYEKGLNFGFPYIHGNNIIDPVYGKLADKKHFIKPVVELHAHVAALGMRFYTGNMFPVKYKNAIFIAEHGSWNSTVPVGYRINLVSFDNKGNPDNSVFASGWLDNNGNAWGRPVDVEIANDGSLLVSDDKAGCIYRIYYDNK